ncbi:MAG: CARDB domain-containing protein, partial [Anaerolineales bacterium]
MMKDNSTRQFLKLLFGVVLAGIILVVCIGISSSSAVRAQDAWTETPTDTSSLTETPSETPAPSLTITETQVPTETSTPTQGPDVTTTPAVNNYYSVEALSLSDGNVIQEMIIHGPPVPPPGYDIQGESVSVPDIINAAGTNILTVPAYPWVYGCSAVSGAMIAGYYDRNGYPNLYTGPTDNGVMPLVDNSSWGSWVDNPPSPEGNFAYFNNPLVASKLGLDSRTTRGSIDDYWVQYDSSAPDPYITGSWTQHSWGDAIGDYMQTSQSAFGLGDAYTRFYDNWSNPAAPLTCASIEAAGYVDGTVGRKQFYQAKGYAVTDCYNQFTDNQYAGGFSFAQYKAEIDAGRPVMINLEGHTIVGVGYADPNIVYIHNTWDSGTYSMTWGGTYSGMDMMAVSIVNLAPSDYSVMRVTKNGNGSGTVISSPAGINCGSNCTYAYDKTTSVTLTATASTPSIFTGWSGGGCSGTGTCTVLMSTAQSVTATFSLPDLTITNLTVLPSAPTVNNDINLSVGVANLGGVDATTFRIEFYVDHIWQSCWDLGVVPYRDFFVRATGLSGNSSGSWSYTIPAGTLSLGTHTVSAYVDMGCEVVEGNETNNSAVPVSVTVSIPAPSAFDLSSPADSATSQSMNPTLQWNASTGAVSYEYCINSVASCVSPAAWISISTNTSIALSGLTPGATYYWQVRARNTSGLTYANGGSSTSGWFSFTVLSLPGSFTKNTPSKAAINQPADLTLNWGTSSNAFSYSYCLDTANDNTCNTSWTSTAANTSVDLSGLTPGITYYWQVRATNANGSTYGDGSSAAWWAFSIQPIPGAFNKSNPINAATNQTVNPTLTWGASSNVVYYQYCIDTVNDNTCNTSWNSTGATPSATLTGLTPGTYYWQVSAVNAMGTRYANGSAASWWSFTIVPFPGALTKYAPINGSTNQPTNPTLSWGASSGAVSYSYCLDTVDDDTCNTSWISTVTGRTKALTGLVPGTTYFWQVRATNTTGNTYADGDLTSWWSFVVPPLPGAFTKTSPVNSATSQPSNPTLQWGTSSNVVSYEYCINTTASCVSPAVWTSTSSNPSIALGGLKPGATYYWQVRARNSVGITYADGGTATTGWYSFTILPLPTAFNKSSPANTATNQSNNPSL